MAEIVVFEGSLPLGDSKNASMVFAQDFRVEQCALKERRLVVECAGVEILGPKEHQEISSHPVYLDHVLVGRLGGDRVEFSVLPAVDAGIHRVEIHVSAFPGFGLCDDFTVKRVVFSCG
jgi:hypothetical protein